MWGFVRFSDECFYLIRGRLIRKNKQEGKTIARPQPRLARRRPTWPQAPSTSILPAGMLPALDRVLAGDGPIPAPEPRGRPHPLGWW